jgi:diguanylate cyclase (GGDEF)-like protein
MLCASSLSETARERDRLAAIADYELADAPGEREFDHIVALAASLFDVPIGLISIVEQDRQVFAARTGLDVTQTAREVSFCSHAIEADGVLIIEDARLDPQFAQNPLVVGPPFIRFYAGAPLRVSSGHVLGTLCVISPEPRDFGPRLVQQLESLAQIVVDRLELRRSERKRCANEVRLAQIAHVDQLTGLPNRALFHEKADQLLTSPEDAYPAAAALLLCDLDGFKDVNDVLGHGVGDKLLAAVGKRLRERTDEAHVLARLGGDEFVFLMPGVGDPREAHRVADAMRACFSEGFRIDGEELQLDTSIGIAIAPHHGRNTDALLASADLALYRAKDMGGGAISFFEPHLRTQVEMRRKLQCELRGAFEAGEFELLYQPQVELADGRIVGAEALLRWRHAEHGLLTPAQFLSVLDRMPLAAAVGEWVLRTALTQAALWRRDGLDLRMGINLFACQFRNGGLPELVAAELARSGVPAKLLEIEVTETIAIKNVQSVASALVALRQSGVSIALDDFGTGYASLSLLKELPVTRLKIDKSFLLDLDPGSCDAAVVDAVLRMGEAFRLGVIAEGVETQAQEDWLRAAGCSEGQGYLYGKPMTADQLAHLARKPLPGHFIDRQIGA